MIRRSQKHTGFTLIELLAVVVLMSVLVGTTVVGLDSIGTDNRLHSGLKQVATFDRLARTNALTSGVPHSFVLTVGQNSCIIKRPKFSDGKYEWSAGNKLQLGDHVTIAEVLIEGEFSPLQLEGEITNIRIQSNGQSLSYAVLIRCGEDSSGAVVIDGITGLASYVLDLHQATLDETVFEKRRALCTD